MKKRVLFCNIAYMQFYDNRVADKPINGGSYVKEKNDALEKYNFQECRDGYYRGFVETKHKKGYVEGIKTNTYNQLCIEKIDISAKDKDFINDVLVVFCAKKGDEGTVIVGWYKNATVYRRREEYDGRQFNIKARVEDSVLLEEYEREYNIPRIKKKGDFGFGQSNVRYADFDKHANNINQIIEYINNYTLENIAINKIVEEEQEIKVCDSEKESELYLENGIAKKVYVNVYERNLQARKECLRINGSKCKICGFDAKEVYGDDYVGKIHVHHIVPIHEINSEYKIDPAKDLIPVCPNCHMILHTKINGNEIKVEELQKIFKNK